MKVRFACVLLFPGRCIRLSHTTTLGGELRVREFDVSAAEGVERYRSCSAILRATSGVRVNSIHPGAIDTEMLTEVGQPEKLVRGTPINRVASPEEVANMALFLAGFFKLSA